MNEERVTEIYIERRRTRERNRECERASYGLREREGGRRREGRERNRECESKREHERASYRSIERERERRILKDREGIKREKEIEGKRGREEKARKRKRIFNRCSSTLNPTIHTFTLTHCSGNTGINEICINM